MPIFAHPAADGTGSLAKRLSRFALALFYGAAGVLHLYAPERFLPIMPDIVPYPIAVILITGFCELAGAFGLLVPRLRRFAGLMLALYALCVFPANIKHAIDGIVLPGLPSGWLYHGPRLAAQPLLIFWTLWMTSWLRNARSS
jgi:uncharacterized membrane protein